MKKPMTIESALELILQACDMTVVALENDGHVTGGALLSRAANILRNMAEEPVEKNEVYFCFVCNGCGLVDEVYQTLCGLACAKCNNIVKKNQVECRKNYNSNRTLKIVETETDVKFEKVEKP